MSGSFSRVIFGDVSGPVHGLRRFSPGFRKPADHSSATARFVEELGADEVAVWSDELFRKLRHAFRYKRREIEFACEGSAASIRTPDFDVLLTLTQDPEAASDYRLRTRITGVRNRERVESEAFAEIFNFFCDTVSLAFPAEIDLEDVIDRIEESDELAGLLDYDPLCTRLTLEFPRISLEILAGEMRFRLPQGRDLRKLLAETEAAVQKLSETGFPGA